MLTYLCIFVHANENKSFLSSQQIQDEEDGSNEYADYQPGSLITRDQLVKELDEIDIVFHIGDIAYSNGYISQWDQFTSQVEPIASTVPYMIARLTNSFPMYKSCFINWNLHEVHVPTVAIMKEMYQGQESSTTVMIRVVNVVC